MSNPIGGWFTCECGEHFVTQQGLESHNLLTGHRKTASITVTIPDDAPSASEAPSDDANCPGVWCGYCRKYHHAPRRSSVPSESEAVTDEEAEQAIKDFVPAWRSDHRLDVLAMRRALEQFIARRKTTRLASKEEDATGTPGISQ